MENSVNDQYDTLDLNNKLIWNLRDIGHTMRHLYEGRGSQRRILIIVDLAGSITQRELTKKLGIKPGSVSEVVRKLELAGLLVRTPSETDRRTWSIALTGTGRAAAEWIRGKREKRHDQMFASLSGEEKQTLLRLLEKVNADWDEKFRQISTEHNQVDYRKYIQQGQNETCGNT